VHPPQFIGPGLHGETPNVGVVAALGAAETVILCGIRRLCPRQTPAHWPDFLASRTPVANGTWNQPRGGLSERP